MPLYEGDVSEYTVTSSSELTRLVVELARPATESEARRVVARLDDDLQGSSVPTNPALDWAVVESMRTRLRTSPGDGEYRVQKLVVACLQRCSRDR